MALDCGLHLYPIGGMRDLHHAGGNQLRFAALHPMFYKHGELRIDTAVSLMLYSSSDAISSPPFAFCPVQEHHRQPKYCTLSFNITALTVMSADTGLDNATRLEDWIPLDLKGKPLYHGIDETERMNHVRLNITTVREWWNSLEQCRKVGNMILEVINAETLSRELRDEIDKALQSARFWADQQRVTLEESQNCKTNNIIGTYDALQLYTASAGYKKIFGYINQVFRQENVSERMIQGAVALVELLTIDVYNLRLDNYGLAQYYNFQDVVHRGMPVKRDVLQAFTALLAKPLKERNFSVPLAFVSTTTNQNNIQEFLNTNEEGKIRLHWKIHVRELDPELLSSYRQQYPASIVSTICAMPISHASEFSNEQEVLLRGPSFQLLRIYEEQAGDHAVHVMEMVMLNANRDHCTELAHNYGKYSDQRNLFGRMCAATKYRVCASLAEQYGLSEAKDYANLYAETLALIGRERTTASLATAHYNIWTTLRPSWIGASIRKAYPEPYARRREIFSRASYGGQDLSAMEKIIDEEYDWQKLDWCNIPRLFGALHMTPALL